MGFGHDLLLQSVGQSDIGLDQIEFQQLAALQGALDLFGASQPLGHRVVHPIAIGKVAGDVSAWTDLAPAVPGFLPFFREVGSVSYTHLTLPTILRV